jgi:DNA-directed RNA polymerase specialized sigma24 family protein
MTSAQESFAITLGRASGRALRRLSGLQRADRDDILATAIMWCWENQGAYNVTVPLEAWVTGAVRDAYKQWARGEARTTEELKESIPVPDETLAFAESRSAAAELVKSLSTREREIACMRAEGYTRAEIRNVFDISKREYDDVMRRISALHSLIPDPVEARRVIKHEQAKDYDDFQPESTNIDKAIGRMFGTDARDNGYLFADDYRMGGRVYCPWEDIRGTIYVDFPRAPICIVKDYEGDAPHRRLLVDDGSNTFWISEDHLP